MARPSCAVTGEMHLDANELHIPVGRAGRARAGIGRRDPQLLGAALSGKLDMIPGRAT
jgi:hypothetical protein